ncbi:DUF1272 domain-containing protein [Maribacter sp.]|nr:DUF1272 domain-containing protein [Maribacter sp.]
MLEIRPSCENCDKDLAPNATDAMICTYECTYCSDCVTNVLHNVCPNCGGGFEKRPIRTTEHLQRHPAKKERLHKPVVMAGFTLLREKLEGVPPNER